jgi:diguanylate cyclase (GGDEF)-like protein
MALHASGDIIYEWDMAGDTLRWFGNVARLFPGREEGVPVSGEAFAGRIHPEDLPQRTRCLNDHLAAGVGYDCEYRIGDGPGLFQWVHDRGAVVAGNGTAAPRLFGAIRLVNTRKHAEAQLEYMANFDELTGHFNKKRLQEALDGELQKASHHGFSGALAVVGVDQLAMINSAYGYEAGDAVLVEIGRRLGECVRDSDGIGRVGGDRFGLLLSRCDREAACSATERAVEAINREPVETPHGLVRITVTAGVVTFSGQSTTSSDLFAKAEGALREAKLHGGNQTGVYEMTEAQRESFRAALDIGGEVEDAMREDRMRFAYQPILSAGDLAPHSYECLLRLERPDGEILPAGRFIPAIEQLGLMRAVEREVIRVALDELDRNTVPTLAINISGLTASDPMWLRQLVERLEARTDLAERLIIEITETAALRDIAETARFVSAVRDLGVRVALDDFGAGFTNFQHLKALTVDIVKIDGSFVRNIDKDVHNRLFVRNLITLASSLDVLCVAECVETAEEAQALHEEGAHLLQGYFYAPPRLTPPWRGQGEGPNLCVQCAPATPTNL